MIQLTKWYCDCVSPEGSAFLGYWAKLSWGPLRIPYVASLYKPATEPASDRCALRACAPPVARNGLLEWECAPLAVRGCWSASVPSYRRVLLDGPAGSIAWECECPAAQAVVDLGDVTQISGTGYAERLTLTIRPRDLPFDELRWGRFVSPADVITWIEWRGPTNRCWVFHNGTQIEHPVVGNAMIDLGDAGTLVLADNVALREGHLAATALRRIPAAEWWLLRGLPGVHERKWLARGTFRSGTASSGGWVIHEVVRLRGER